MSAGDQPAFARPAVPVDGDDLMRDFYGSQSGLTKREYFAAAALQGLAAGPAITVMKPGNVAQYAVDLADLTLAALERSQP